ncbi:radical SAM protein [Candidatus Methanoperedens nitratireducens]|uniref:Radical SAM core domain-containing protein n=1 Tax=Candidatus Methanoperedens nitratireducens TaxID=1392998 RepID=A0A284VP73_9EURY|nr:radical SAM protein [Candidatus Methanoperedens nitroreducens]SNQ61096.1 hypothetical protein MNV_230017 [Candidatus Methanoperedens nitroreducens]
MNKKLNKFWRIKRYILTTEGHPHRCSQILNLIRYKFSKKSIILRYDPITLSIASTDRCNLNCDMCHAHSKHIGDFEFKHKSTIDVNFDLFKDFVNKFNKALDITIIGSGEPLLNIDFFKMVDYGTRIMKMNVSTNTNGVLLEKAIIEKIISSRLSQITISVNGDNQEEFHRITGMPIEIYRRIIENINSLVSKKIQTKSKITVGLNFIIDKENYRRIPLIIELCEKLCVDSVYLINFLPTPFPGFTADERCLKDNDIEAMDFINNLKKKKYKVDVVWPVLLDNNKRKICEQHFTTMRLDGDGNIGGCAVMLLNLERNGKYSDKNVWNNRYFKLTRSIFLDHKIDRRPEPCKICSRS